MFSRGPCGHLIKKGERGRNLRGHENLLSVGSTHSQACQAATWEDRTSGRVLLAPTPSSASARGHEDVEASRLDLVSSPPDNNIVWEGGVGGKKEG